MIELAVLVPVLNRPQNVAPLVASFLATRPPSSQLWFFITMDQDHDEYAECLRVMHDVALESGADMKRIDERWPVNLRCSTNVTWPQKINFGITQVDAEWYLCAADDVAFHDGWFQATKTLRDENWGMIGTNDLGNPRVIAGDHTCHPLVSRRYANLGGLDGGPLCYEGVHHWYTDDILIASARQRGEWASCPTAVVEHLHPYWRPEVPTDATYAKGESTQLQDRDAAMAWAREWLR